MEILQAKILEWVAISYSRGSSCPRSWTWVSCVSCIDRQTLHHWATWEAPYLYIHPFFFGFPSPLGYHLEFPVLYSRFSLVIYFIPGGGDLVSKSCPTLATPWTLARQAFCPWNSPGKSTGVGCHFLLHLYIYQSYAPSSSHPALPTTPSPTPWCPYVCSVPMCLYFCFANRFICIIF